MDGAHHECEIGIQIVDRDHREISKLLVEINVTTEKDGDAGRKILLLRDLARVTQSHFLLEEWMMAATNYPSLDLHRQRHAWMLEEIRRLAEHWGKERSDLIRESMGYLWESHIEHVECEDEAYGLWLGATGGKSKLDRILFSMNP